MTNELLYGNSISVVQAANLVDFIFVLKMFRPSIYNSLIVFLSVFLFFYFALLLYIIIARRSMLRQQPKIFDDNCIYSFLKRPEIFDSNYIHSILVGLINTK